MVEHVERRPRADGHEQRGEVAVADLDCEVVAGRVPYEAHVDATAAAMGELAWPDLARDVGIGLHVGLQRVGGSGSACPAASLGSRAGAVELPGIRARITRPSPVWLTPRPMQGVATRRPPARPTESAPPIAEAAHLISGASRPGL